MKTIKLNKNSKKIGKLQILIFVFIFLFSNSNLFAQSTDQETPTPITSNEIKGEIQARAVGDPRLTNFFYTFSGEQGDVFVNVVTKNLDGDIDIFTFYSLEPLTKIPVFSGGEESETGRVVYLRKAEKLILRVQGRTPNDDPATFQIKFAGSFVPMQIVSKKENSDLPEIDVKNQGEARVSSVGTIIEVFPKAIPTPDVKVSQKISQEEIIDSEPVEKEITVSTINKDELEKDATRIEIKKEGFEEKSGIGEKLEKEDKTAEKIAENKADETSGNDLNIPPPPPKEIETGNIKGTVSSTNVKSDADKTGGATLVKSDADKTNSAKADDDVLLIEENKDDLEEKLKNENLEKDSVEDETAQVTTEIQPVEPGQLANIEIVVNFKNGTKFKRSMDKITWFNVDKGILTIITTDGTILKFSMLDVEKMTFEKK